MSLSATSWSTHELFREAHESKSTVKPKEIYHFEKKKKSVMIAIAIENDLKVKLIEI